MNPRRDRVVVAEAGGSSLSWSELVRAARAGGPSCEGVATDRLRDVVGSLAGALTQGRHLVLLRAGASSVERELARQQLKAALDRAADAGPTLGKEVPDPDADREVWLQHWRRNTAFRLTLLTTGTTGRPRAVTQTLEGLLRGVRVPAGERAGRTWGLGYHPAHMAGIQVILQALWEGSCLVPLHGLESGRLETCVPSRGIDTLAGTPSFFRLQLPFSRPRPEIGQVSLGGERCDAVLLEKLHTTFPQARVRNIYALTEAGSLFAAEGEWLRIPDRIADQVRIEADELWLHRNLLGEGVELAGDWFATGDRVCQDPRDPRRFRIDGRRGTTIHTAGYRVDPEAVEGTLRTLPDIAFAHVYGRSNPVVGTVLCADLAGRQRPDAEIRAALSEMLADYQIPRILHWLADVELGPGGKMPRRKNAAE